MDEIAIRINNLSKRYRISAAQENMIKPGSLDVFIESFKYVIETIRPPREDETLWALQDVSLEIKQGEVVGIIGPNGAGKSTLLKLISRITEPTSGRIELYGRTSSLLEVGTGFHPDLTGRENVHVSGMMLGMTQEEIDKKYLLNLSYPDHLWQEKEIKSVANVTRRDVREFLQLAAEIPIKPEYQSYELKDANHALLELKQQKIRGAKVLVISKD